MTSRKGTHRGIEVTGHVWGPSHRSPMVFSLFVPDTGDTFVCPCGLCRQKSFPSYSGGHHRARHQAWPVRVNVFEPIDQSVHQREPVLTGLG